MIHLSPGDKRSKSYFRGAKINKMNSFMDWYQNKVQAVTPISDESFCNILEKI